MKGLVTVKRCIDYAIKTRVRTDGSGVEINNIKHSMNPFDEIAVEETVRQKEKKNLSEVIALSIGPSKSQETLRTALALGVDKAILVETDQRVDQQIQPFVVAKIVQHMVQKHEIDVVFMGKQSIDDDFVQTPQILASLMDWPQATFASSVEFMPDNMVQVVREVDGGLETVKFKLPGVISCDLRLNQPRFASLPNIMKAKKKPMEIIKWDQLVQEIGLEQQLNVINTSEAAQRQSGVMVESVDELIDKLKNDAKVI